MNKETRNLSELYKLVKERLEEYKANDCNNFICNCIQNLTYNREVITEQENELLLKDFESHKEDAGKLFPEGWNGTYAWWETENYESRLKFLDYLIDLHSQD